MKVVLFLGLLVATVFGWTKKALQDKITNLPGLPSDANYTQFAGYLTVDETNGRNLFYWFVLSLNDPSTDPVVLWTNGGPGCSGLGGFFTEQGPFRAQPDGSLTINEYSWVNAANMFFIEQPAGVGFSYSNTPSDYNTGDAKAAADNYKMIKMFLNTFPEFQANKFYVSSESYGGHYAPQMTQELVKGQSNGDRPRVNFGGVFLGNPYTDPVENAKGQYDTWWGHQLVSQPVYKDWFYNCSDGTVNNNHCYNLENTMSTQVGNVDPYALDYPVCNLDARAKRDERYTFVTKVIHEALGRPIPNMKRILAEPYQPCSQNYATTYLNNQAVQTAIHAKVGTQWSDCSSIVNYNMSDMANPMEPVWQWLFQNAGQYRYTIYSGDDDSVCGTLGTQSWIWKLGYNVELDANWKVWSVNEQVAGYLTKFPKALNFVTVHGAGHLVPMTTPEKSLHAFKNYLSGVF